MSQLSLFLDQRASLAAAMSRGLLCHLTITAVPLALDISCLSLSPRVPGKMCSLPSHMAPGLVSNLGPPREPTQADTASGDLQWASSSALQTENWGLSAVASVAKKHECKCTQLVVLFSTARVPGQPETMLRWIPHHQFWTR